MYDVCDTLESPDVDSSMSKSRQSTPSSSQLPQNNAVTGSVGSVSSTASNDKVSVLSLLVSA